MKKFVLAITCLAGISLSASAQYVRFGVKGGVTGTLANLESTPFYRNDGNELGVGGYIGGQAEVSFKKRTDKFKMQLEVLANYNTLRNEIETLGFVDGDTRMNIHSVAIPLLAKYFFQPNFSLYVGPTFNINFLSRYATKVEPSTKWAYSNEDNAKKALNPFQVGVMAGANYYIHKGLYLEARYQLIAPSVTDNTTYGIPNYGNINNFSIGLGYKYKNRAK